MTGEQLRCAVRLPGPTGRSAADRRPPAACAARYRPVAGPQLNDAAAGPAAGQHSDGAAVCRLRGHWCSSGGRGRQDGRPGTGKPYALGDVPGTPVSPLPAAAAGSRRDPQLKRAALRPASDKADRLPADRWALGRLPDGRRVRELRWAVRLPTGRRALYCDAPPLLLLLTDTDLMVPRRPPTTGRIWTARLPTTRHQALFRWLSR